MGSGICSLDGCGNRIESDNPRARFCCESHRKIAYDRARPERSRDRHRLIGDRLPVFERPFVAFDGEGYGSTLALIASSDGRKIHRRSGLSTIECFDYLLGTDPMVNAVWYGFGWDVNMILRDVPLQAARGGSIEQLYRTTRTIWRGYRIRYVPRRFFDVTELRPSGGRKKARSFHSYDTIGFFQATFAQALATWKIPVPEIITEGKAARGSFETWKMRDLIAYNDAELVALVELMDRFREAVRRSGWTVSSWHGAGALASRWLAKHNAHTMLVAPEGDVADAAARAYFGGRVEMGAWGRADPIYHYDVNSAYPAAMRGVVDLSRVRWARYGPRSPGATDQPFALLHVRWSMAEPADHQPFWGPFPWRDRSGRIIYPAKGEGWYWASEVAAAIERLPKMRIKIVESFRPVGEISHPLAEPIESDYAYRAQLKRSDDPANVPIKLALNSLYGRLAMRAVFDGKRSRHYSLLWAGFVTAGCRSKISDALAAADGQAVLTMTDGIYSMVPLDLPISDRLGDWSFEKDDRAIVAIQAGVYRIEHSDGSVSDFTRGFERGAPIDFPAIIDWWARGLTEPAPQTVFEISRFVGMGLAINFANQYRPHFRSFTTITRELKAVPIHGTSKRIGTGITDQAQPVFMAPHEWPGGLSHRYRAITDQEIADPEVAIAREDRIAAADYGDEGGDAA